MAPDQRTRGTKRGDISFIKYIFDIFVLNGPYIEFTISCNFVHVRLSVIFYVPDTWCSSVISNLVD